MIAFDHALCNGCETCAVVCPHGVIEMVAKKAVATAEVRCIECGACKTNCDEGAVTVTTGAGCLFAILKEELLGRRGADACC